MVLGSSPEYRPYLITYSFDNSKFDVYYDGIPDSGERPSNQGES